MSNFTDKYTAKLWDERMVLSAKDGPLTESEADELRSLNEEISSDGLDLDTCECAMLHSTPFIEALNLAIGMHMHHFKQAKKAGDGLWAERALVNMYYTAWVYCIQVSTTISGNNVERFSNYSSNTYHSVCAFIRKELDIQGCVSEDERFSWVDAKIR